MLYVSTEIRPSVEGLEKEQACTDGSGFSGRKADFHEGHGPTQYDRNAVRYVWTSVAWGKCLKLKKVKTSTPVYTELIHSKQTSFPLTLTTRTIKQS